jgi:hypothetical protein
MPYTEEEQDTEQSASAKTGDEALLQEIRERYTHEKSRWSNIREQSAIDRRYIAGDPWEAKDRKAREDAGRPCISHDELGQFVNQAINGVRQSPPGIKIDPAGNGATEKTAETHQDLVRTIEYESDAQSAYITAFQNALEGSYGFFRLSRGYEHNIDDLSLGSKLFDQRIQVKAILNSDAVLYDSDCKEPDWSDARYCFVFDPIPRDEFAREHPNAKKTSFGDEDMKTAPDWIQSDKIVIAEYWKAKTNFKTLYLLDNDQVATSVPEGRTEKKRRVLKTREIIQYKTNGVEILSTNPQPGTIIPIIPVTGKEMYVDDGSGPERRLISLVRLARDPQMSLAYLNSLEMEEAGLTPKVPYVGYKGQFESDAEAWEEITKVPHSFLQTDVVVDGATQTVLPLPRREQFTPNFAAYEVAKDSCRRAIQAAMGITPLPTAAQRNNEKSGVALQRIQQAQSVGSFHFTANLHRALRLAGKVMEEWFLVVYDSEREISLTKADGKRNIVTINTDQPYLNKNTNQQEHYPITEGTHDVTISVAPSSESTREAAGEFLDQLIGSLGKLPIAPPQQAKLLSMAIQMKQLGPKGDQMAEIISPPDQGGELPPQAQQAIAAAQGQLQQMQGELQKLIQEKQGKVVEGEMRKQLEEMKQRFDALKLQMEFDHKERLERMKIEASMADAEITTKAQSFEERMKFVEDMYAKLSDQSHEAGMQAADHQHEAEMTVAQQQAAAEQQQNEQAHESDQTTQDQAFQAQQAEAAQQQQEQGPEEQP